MNDKLSSINGNIEHGPLPTWFSHLGVGVFETLRARYVKGQVWILGLKEHLDRLEEGNRVINSRLYDRFILENNLEALLREFDWKQHSNARVRITLLKTDLILSIEPWQPTYDIQNGIEAISYRGERCLPELKSCSAIVAALAREAALVQGASEAFLIDRNSFLTEGSWSNFFWINKDGQLQTPKNNLLKGVTRSFVMELARQSMEVKEEDATLAEILKSAREAFLTQTSHGIVPVVKLDDQVLSGGSPGKLSKELIDIYHSFFESGKQTKKIELKS